MKYNRLLRALSLCLLASLLAAAALPAYAAAVAEPEIVTGGIQWVGTGKSPVIIDNLPEGALIVSINSSKPDVLKVGKGGGIGPHNLWKKPLKAGKSRVTVKYRVRNKTKSVKAIFTVKDYPAPFEYIKVDGKKVDLKQNMASLVIQNYSKTRITIKFKLKSGWKAIKCHGYRVKDGEWKEITWKNGEAISFKKNCALNLFIDVKNKKTGETCNFEFAITH